MKDKRRRMIQICLLTAAAVFIVAGVLRGEAAAVLTKAVHICMECIGLG